MTPIIDLHCHYIASDPDAVENFKRLVESPELHRVAVCALDLKLDPSPEFPYMSKFATTNEQLADLVERVDSPKLLPFCSVDPRDADAARQVEHWVGHGGMRGVKLYPPSGWYPDEPRVLPTFQAIEALGVPVLLHMGRVAPHPQLRSKYARPICLEDVGLACPRIKLIIGHFGAPWRMEAAHVAMSFEHFYLDLTTSGSADTAMIDYVIRKDELGLRRIVLGTDGDGSNNLQRAAATLAHLRAAGLTDPQLQAMAHDNALPLLPDPA